MKPGLSGARLLGLGDPGLGPKCTGPLVPVKRRQRQQEERKKGRCHTARAPGSYSDQGRSAGYLNSCRGPAELNTPFEKEGHPRCLRA